MEELTITLRATEQNDKLKLEWLNEIGDEANEKLLCGVNDDSGFLSFRMKKMADRENERILREQ